MEINKNIGVSFSVKECRNYGIEAGKALEWLLGKGFRRFRIMSYWNEHEKQPGTYDFESLDTQIQAIIKAGGVFTLCLGARQPRWPENHWPDWAWQLTPDERTDALLSYIRVVVERYRDTTSLVSYQLENEALLLNFGERAEVDRERLRTELKLVKELDPQHPVIMTTSTSWGIPLRRPIPDMVGFSFYNIVYRDGEYHRSLFYPWVHRLRKTLIYLLHRKHTFIHELQLEPWGPAANWKMTSEEQDKSMNADQIHKNIALARAIKAMPIDLWGGEWWYWRSLHGDDHVWQAVHDAITDTK